MHLHRLTAAVVFLVLGLAGCSADKPDPGKARASTETTKTESKAPPPPGKESFLTRSEVERYPPGSPERAAFTFWLQIQYRDLLSAYESLTPEFQTEYAGSLKRFGEYIMADHARWLTKPRLLFVRSDGDQATVALGYRNRGGVPERSSFSLRRSPDGWAVAYDFYLADRLQAN